MGMRANIYPLNSGQLFRRWQPGQGYRSDPGVTGIGLFRGFSGMGDDTTDPTTSDGSVESQLIAAGVDPADAGAYSALPGGSTAMPASGPAPDLTPTELAAEQQRATDWLAQIPNIVNTTTKAALTAAQIAAGVNAGALKASSTCPSGYLISGSGQCVVTATAGILPGVTNAQLMTWGMVIVGGLLFVKLASRR